MPKYNKQIQYPAKNDFDNFFIKKRMVTFLFYCSSINSVEMVIHEKFDFNMSKKSYKQNISLANTYSQLKQANSKNFNYLYN